MMSRNGRQDIDRKVADIDYRINVKADRETELLHEKIDQLREREEQLVSGARKSDADGERPS
jgi:uncharacterized membrane protein